MSDPPSIVHSTVTAPDGTLLAVMQLGSGPPLVICHGAFTVAQDWLPFAAEMAATHRVHLYDRRGRGNSQSYCAAPSLEAEVDDLAAVVAHAGPGTAILGHSFGGACALAYAARERFAGPLIVYEPPHPSRGPVSRGLVPDVEHLIASDDLDAATRFAMTRVVGMPPEAIAGLAASPLWKPMCQTVRAFPNELRFLDNLTWQNGELDGIGSAPTLLLGAETADIPEALGPVSDLQTLLPELRIVPIPGQGHIAYLLDPAGLAALVGRCLSEQ
jgi:pimeloyl-ACP methyl ester carboxylesterase